MSLLEVKDLHTYFDTSHGVIKAVKGVSFSLEEKQTIGIVGESGSGKSQTVMSILKLFESNQRIAQGEVWFNGNRISEYTDKQLEVLRGNDIAVIFQDSISCLNPVFTIQQQITEVLRYHRKLSKKEAIEESIRMLESVKIPQPDKVMKQYPHQLSGGMSQRVMIAIALACQPKILIADEPTTALDVIIQDEILNLMQELKDSFETSILFISHDLGVVSKVADEIIVMNHGVIVEQAPTKEIVNNPIHPYTKQLLNAFIMTDIQKHDAFEKKINADTKYDLLPYTIKWPLEEDNDWIEIQPKHYVRGQLK